MLNKEDILALAWEHSEGSGKRYIFTEESLFAFLKELDKEPPPAQDEREAQTVEEPTIVAYGDPKAFKNLRIDGHKGAPYNHEWMWAAAAPGLVPMIELDQHKRIVAALTRPAQTEQQPEQSGLVEALEEIASGLQAEFAWEVAEQALAAYRAMLAAQETNKI